MRAIPPNYNTVHKCQLCSQLCYSKTDLLSHINQKHNTERPKNNIQTEQENRRNPQNPNVSQEERGRWRLLTYSDSGIEENTSLNEQKNPQNRQMAPKIDKIANEKNSSKQTSNDDFVNLYNAVRQALNSNKKPLTGKLSITF